MSPESTPSPDQPKSEMIEVPDWKNEEQAQTVDYIGYTDEIITNAPNLNPIQVRESIADFLKVIESDIENGAVVGSNGQAYTVEDWMSQLNKFVELSNRPQSDESAINYITRSLGLRKSIGDLASNEQTGARLMDALTGRLLEYAGEVQEKKDIGGQALEEAGIEEPEAIIDNPTPEAAQEALTARDEVNSIEDIHARRAINDYVMYMNAADKNIKINGYNKDAEEDRKRANQAISSLPSSMRELARRYYEESKNI